MGNCEVPATVGQRLLWMIARYRPGYGSLNCPVLCRIRGPLSYTALEKALDQLTVRHDSLRTTFTGAGRSLMQVIHDPQPVDLLRFDLSHSADPRAAVEESLSAEQSRPVDPASWPTRATLWRVGADEHVLCLNMHHMVTDAWSSGILFRELRQILCEPARSGGSEPETYWQFREFADYQRELFESGALQRHREYWRRQLAGASLPTLGPDRGNGAETSGNIRVLSTELPASVVAGLQTRAREEGTSFFSIMLAVEYALLNCVTGQEDLAIASLFANRSRPESRGTVGFLANMVILRTRFAASATFAELLREAHRTVAAAFAYQELPYQMLPADTMRAGPQRADDVVFHMVGDPGYHDRTGLLDMELLIPDKIGGRFRFELTIVPHGTTCSAVLFYRDDWIDSRLASQFLSWYGHLARLATASPGARLTELRAQLMSGHYGVVAWE